MREVTLPVSIPLVNGEGQTLGHLQLTPRRDLRGEPSDSIICIEPASAEEWGESQIQLKEAETYEYHLRDAAGLRIRSSFSKRFKSLSHIEDDAGLIETGNFCGALLFELVEDESGEAVATALIHVRSVKVDYRTEYRGMLINLTDRVVGLIVNAQSSAKVSFRSNFEERTDTGWLQLQLELLRETLEGSEFDAAVSRILAHPHERLAPQEEVVRTDRPIRHTSATIRQLIHGSPRQGICEGHPLQTGNGIKSVAERIIVSRHSRDLDTPENRFIKNGLESMRAFLDHAATVFEGVKGWGASAETARRLSQKLKSWLGRSFFQAIGPMQHAPLGSPVLQRKAGYREVLRTWLRFRTAAELSWKGGEDVFKAGQRDVATLYEYWLFFVLLDWFCETFNGAKSPAIEKLISGLDGSELMLKVRRRVPLGPFIGHVAEQGRKLYASFDYNRVFKVSHQRGQGGSWSRQLHPDYTLTFWPVMEDLSPDEALAVAERQEMLVHIHLDAKYRIASYEALFGREDSEDADVDQPESPGNYKRQDLLKMHAYRDAIKRSEGAYVLYPGDDACRSSQHDPKRVGADQWRHTMRGFHEILPGVGAFAIRPSGEGSAIGLQEFSAFMDEVLLNLCDRASLRERRTSDLYEVLRERRSLYELMAVDSDIGGPDLGGKIMRRVGELDGDRMRIPAAQEIKVIVAWYKGSAELRWMVQHGKVIVRLGQRRGSLPVVKNLAAASHILLHGPDFVVEPGLLMIGTSTGKVLTRAELAERGYPTSASADPNHIYAVFDVEPDPAFADFRWNGQSIEKVLIRHRARVRPSNRPEPVNFHRERTKPFLVALADLEVALD